MASLDEAVDRLGAVPQDIRRFMDLIKDLDTQWAAKMALLKREQAAYVERVRRAVKGKPRDGSVNLVAVSEDREWRSRIEVVRREVTQLSDEKVLVAQQAYDLVDMHIQKLDVDLKSFEEVLLRSGQLQPRREAGDDGAGDDDEDYDSSQDYDMGGTTRAPARQAAGNAQRARPSASGGAPSHRAAGGDGAGPETLGHMDAAAAAQQLPPQPHQVPSQQVRQLSMNGGPTPAVASDAHQTYAPGAAGPASVPQVQHQHSQRPGPFSAFEDVNMSGGRAADDGFAQQRGDDGGGASAAEPNYCICQRPSYGEMIGCDNTSCSYEWFHLACVGISVVSTFGRSCRRLRQSRVQPLSRHHMRTHDKFATQKPKGRWYCPTCRQSMPNKKKNAGGPRRFDNAA